MLRKPRATDVHFFLTPGENDGDSRGVQHNCSSGRTSASSVRGASKIVNKQSRSRARTQAAAVATHSNSAPKRWLFSGATLLGVFLYTLWFFCAPSAPVFRRQIWAFLVVPEDLIPLWYGMDMSRIGVLGRLPVLAIALFVHVWSVLLGALALRPLRLREQLTALERYLFYAGAGLNLLATLTLLLGLAGQLRHRGLFGGLATVTALGFIALRIREKKAGSQATQDLSEETPRSALRDEALPSAVRPIAKRRDWLWCVVAAPFALSILLGSLLPSWQFDVREYHLQVPKEWFLAGRVTFLPHNIYGNMPLAAEMPSIVCMLFTPGSDAWWYGALSGKVLLGSYAYLGALGLYAAGRRFVSLQAGAAAAVLYLSLPWIAHVSMAGLIEGAVAFYALLAAYALALARIPQQSEGSGALRWILLSGISAGSAAACKYPAVVFVVLPLLFGVAYLRWSIPRRKVVVAFLMGAAATAGPWYLKNLALTGNPTYPLLYSVFDGASWTQAKDTQWSRAHGVPHDAAGHSYRLSQLLDSAALLLWRSDFLSPLAWPLAAIGAWRLRRRRLVQACLLGLVFWFFAWWALTHRLDRFFVPAFVFVCGLAGIGWAEPSSRGWRIGLGALMLGGLVFCWLVLNSRYLGDNRYFVSYAQLRDDAPHPAEPEYHRSHLAIRYLNERVQPGYRALLVGEAKAFDLNVPVLYNTCFDDCQLETLLAGRSRDERLAALRAARVSHVFVFWYELDRHRDTEGYGYSDFPTRELVRQELVQEQGLLRKVELDLEPENGELFEVVGWESWQTDSP